MSDDRENVAVTGLTPEQEELLVKLQTIKAATAPAAKPVCPACGSDGHEHCRRAAHHGGASEARDSAARAN